MEYRRPGFGSSDVQVGALHHPEIPQCSVTVDAWLVCSMPRDMGGEPRAGIHRC